MSNLKAIEQNVAQNTNLEQSAVALVNGLAAELDQLTNDPVAIKQLADDLRSNAATLGKAVCANTPAAATTPTGAAVAPSTPPVTPTGATAQTVTSPPAPPPSPPSQTQPPPAGQPRPTK